MKKLTPIAIVAFFFAIALSSCSPYEEGPAISFRSKAERLANTWSINYAVEADGDDKTSDYSGDVYLLDKDGNITITFTEAGTTFEATGTWTLTNDDENIRIQSSYTVPVINLTISSDETYEILKLKENEVWIKDVDDDGLEIHFVP